jgi:threonine aldolase
MAGGRTRSSSVASHCRRKSLGRKPELITPIDLRSDTVTKPTPGMRAAMAAAEVGDDVLAEDPTVNALEARIAGMLGKEAAMFVPSGTMSNQIAVRVHCGPGDEFLCEANCHIFNYEQGAYAQLFGVAAQPVEGEYGVLRPEQFVDRIRPIDNHSLHTRLVCLENTHNRGAGRVLPYEGVVEICKWAAENGLARHLDGARLFNAAVASGIALDKWAAHFDTVSVCFSKSLGAPVGSALCGSAESIQRARRHRKALGGAMRQAGIIAAGALYALEHHIDRLAEDHEKARVLADAIREIPGLALDPAIADTNIVIFKIDPKLGTAKEFAVQLKERGVLVYDVGRYRLRAVTHMDVTMEQIRNAGKILRDVTQTSR